MLAQGTEGSSSHLRSKADCPPGHRTARSLTLWHLPAASPGQGAAGGPSGSQPAALLPGGVLGQQVHAGKRLQASSGPWGLDSWGSDGKTPLAQACHLWPCEPTLCVLSSNFVSPACLASLSEASAPCPELGWPAPSAWLFQNNQGKDVCPPHVGRGRPGWGGGPATAALTLQSSPRGGCPQVPALASLEVGGVWPPFLFGCYKDRPCKAVLARAQIGLVLCLGLPSFPLLTGHEGEE